jgi:hypothetical protein
VHGGVLNLGDGGAAWRPAARLEVAGGHGAARAAERLGVGGQDLMA